MLYDNLKQLIVVEPKLQHILDNLVIKSLVKRDEDIACATITVTTLLKEHELLERLNSSALYHGHSYRFDAEFYDITPIYEHESHPEVE